MPDKMKHTPGPWVVTTDKFNRCYVWRSGDEKAGSNRLSICATHYNHSANARLIAAAPKLLEACKKDAERIRQLCGMVNDFAEKLGLGKKVNPDDWDDAARAAIAKAKGDA